MKVTPRPRPLSKKKKKSTALQKVASPHLPHLSPKKE